MAIITISRGSYSRGKEIAEKLAAKLGYSCVSREVILSASELFNIPEIKLVRALHDSPSALSRFTHGEKRYIAFIRYAIFNRIRQDNVVYHGLAGHFFLQDIKHILKVRIIADLETRISEEMKRENISERKARHILVKDDQERQRWALALYGIETWDPKLYNAVLQVGCLKTDDIVDILADISTRSCFITTDETKKQIEDRYFAAKIEVALIEKFPEIKVNSTNGSVYIKVRSLPNKKRAITEEISKIISDTNDIKELKVEIDPIIIPD